MSINNNDISSIENIITKPDPTFDFLVLVTNTNVNGNMNLDLNQTLSKMISDRAAKLGLNRDTLAKNSNYVVAIMNNKVGGTVNFNSGTTVEKFADKLDYQENKKTKINIWLILIILLIIIYTCINYQNC